ncbi:MAG: hypothetical protein ACRCW3_00020 [Metamycoplasmataceae bacterium]
MNIYNVAKALYFRKMLFFWTFYSLNNPKIVHNCFQIINVSWASTHHMGMISEGSGDVSIHLFFGISHHCWKLLNVNAKMHINCNNAKDVCAHLSQIHFQKIFFQKNLVAEPLNDFFIGSLSGSDVYVLFDSLDGNGALFANLLRDIAIFQMS